VLGAIWVLAAGGCITERTVVRGPGKGVTGTQRSGAAVAAARPAQPVVRQAALQTATQPLGAIPFDEFVLPVVSPHGEFIATQAGVAPTWATTLAEPGAQVPRDTRVEIYRLRERGEPEPLTVLDQPALLGRSCDDEGFLIEAPQPDGSRWIGKAAWLTGRVEWLVGTPHINAFAALGTEGRLAWSRRMVQGDGFELVVRTRDGEWSIPAADEDWLMPTWSQTGERLFALRLRHRRLDLASMSAADRETTLRTLRTEGLATDASIETAYAMTSAQIGIAGHQLPAAAGDWFLFYHPVQNRMALWRPPGRDPGSGTGTSPELSAAATGAAPADPAADAAGAAGRGTMLMLERHSVAAAMIDADRALVGTEEELLVQHLADLRHCTRIGRGTIVPRPTAHPDRPFVLLVPREGGVVELAGLRLLEPARATASP
jgi:hypothetical protein